MWRTNANTIEWGRVRSGPECFSTGLYDIETVAGRDVLFWGAKHTELPNRAESGGLPRRRSRRGKANSKSASALQLGADGARQVLFDARPGRSRHRLLPPREQSAQARQRCRWRPGRRPKIMGTMGQFFYSHAIYSYPTIMYFKPESPVSSCTACRRRGASRKKKVLVHGLLQRVHPRLVGSSREELAFNFS